MGSLGYIGFVEGFYEVYRPPVNRLGVLHVGFRGFRV